MCVASEVAGRESAEMKRLLRINDAETENVDCSEFPLRLFSAVVTVSNVIFRRGLAKPATAASSSAGPTPATKTTPKRVTVK